LPATDPEDLFGAHRAEKQRREVSVQGSDLRLYFVDEAEQELRRQDQGD
jgi:hypothetical protein